MTELFNSARLRAVREMRGIKANALAEIVGVSAGALSHWETGRTQPRPEMIEALSKALRVPSIQFFMRDDEEEENPLYFRSLSAATKQSRERAIERHKARQRILSFVSDYVDLPELQLPAFNVPSDPQDLDASDIEDLAVSLRRHWNLGDGPITNTVRLLEAKGAIVARDQLGSNLDAFSVWSSRDGRPWIILSVEKSSAARSRLDLAHELAHLILHREVPKRAGRRPEVHRLMEDQAFAFGGAFLMPRSSFLQEVRSVSLDSLLALKPRWGVSVAAMLMRLKQLEVVTEPQFTRLWKSLSRRKWRTREPLDEDLSLEQPTVLPAALRVVIEAGILEPEDFLRAVGLYANDIESLTGSNVDVIFERTFAKNVVSLPSEGTRSMEQTPQRSESAQIIKFRSRKQ